jgi:threonine/homoserine/homoserine lactone efflux protein
MPLHLWLAFVTTSAVLLVIPGPTILTVVSYAVAHGRRANLALVTGVALGDCTSLAISLLGLGALLRTAALAFTVVKWAGGLYLLYLGLRLLRAGGAAAETSAGSALESRGRVFLNTYLVTALNPKGIVFFVAFLPQFLDPSAPAGPQLWLLAGTFVVLAIINATLYTAFASAARRLWASPRAQRCFHLTGGSLLSAAGVWALLARRPA